MWNAYRQKCQSTYDFGFFSSYCSAVERSIVVESANNILVVSGCVYNHFKIQTVARRVDAFYLFGCIKIFDTLKSS